MFRCSSSVSDSSIEKKYKEEVSDFTDKKPNVISRIDMKYFCTALKPLYVVKL